MRHSTTSSGWPFLQVVFAEILMMELFIDLYLKIIFQTFFTDEIVCEIVKIIFQTFFTDEIDLFYIQFEPTTNNSLFFMKRPS